MNLARASRTLGLVALAVIAGPFAVADDSGWYGAINIGQSRANIDDTRITGGLLAGGVTAASITDDDHHFGYKVSGGYRFHQYFALEGGYFDLGKFGFTATTTPAGTLSGTIEIKGVNLDAVGMLPFTDKFSAFGRFGVNYAEAKDFFAGTGSVNVPNPNRKERTANYKFGLGLEYDFTKHLGLRAEAERYRINDAVGNKGDIDLVSLGLVYRFGVTTPAPSHAAGPSAAAPVMIVVPAPARTHQYCSILDIQFEINLYEIQREDKERLAVVGTFLTKYPDTTAVIEGHTDNVGSPESNMKLSQRRAQSVVSYLVDTFHIAPSRLTAVGFGETRPLADNHTEEGKRRNRRIGAVIACATDIEGLEPIPGRITMAMEMEFDTNRADVRPQYREELRKVANFMTTHPAVTATVEGHTSNQQGTPDQAMQLSRSRAESVVNYMVDDFGISRSRLSAVGFGQTRRFAYNTSAEGQQENRRVNIIFNYPN